MNRYSEYGKKYYQENRMEITIKRKKFYQNNVGRMKLNRKRYYSGSVFGELYQCKNAYQNKPYREEQSD